uniref:Uncharacterized protein n=1 Tax=Arundo donax TaxID=35708 RepID=A0A0A9AIT6_ARUDO
MLGDDDASCVLKWELALVKVDMLGDDDASCGHIVTPIATMLL